MHHQPKVEFQSILKRYSRVKEVYDLRCQFRQQAFKKEHWDLGHEFKIESILTKLIEYENHLATIFHQNSMEPIEVESEKIDDDDESNETEDVELSDRLATIHQQNQSIIAEERCWAEESR